MGKELRSVVAKTTTKVKKTETKEKRHGQYRPIRNNIRMDKDKRQRRESVKLEARAPKVLVRRVRVLG
jgi:hypothetical protein